MVKQADLVLTIRLAPRLPAALTTLSFTVRWRGRRLHVEITAEKAGYRLREGDELNSATTDS
jgi:alpha,alpha-trehalose phosphorylase